MALFEAVTLGMFGGYTEAADKFMQTVRQSMTKTQEEAYRKAAEKTGRRLTNGELMGLDMITRILIDDIPPYLDKDFQDRILKYKLYFKHRRRSYRPRRRRLRTK